MVTEQREREPQSRPNFNLGRGGGTTTKKPRTKASLATKYLVDREAALRHTHQAALDDWVQTNSGEYGTIGEAVRAYFYYYVEATVEAEEEYQRRLEQIENDKLLDSVRRHQALTNLQSPTRPAWNDERERGWIRTYDDPRADTIAWNAAVTRQQLATVETWRNGDIVDYHRTPWEVQAPIILENAEWDGSVMPVKLITEERISSEAPDIPRLDADAVNDPAPKATGPAKTGRPSGRRSPAAKRAAEARKAAATEAQAEAEEMTAAEAEATDTPEQNELRAAAHAAAYETPDGAAPLENAEQAPQTDETAEAPEAEGETTE